jgi:hypothetical protein
MAALDETPSALAGRLAAALDQAEQLAASAP